MYLTQYFRWLGLTAFLLLSLLSCKKVEEEETKSDSMSGVVAFNIPYYVLKGETVTMSASGVIYPKEARYRWYINNVYVDSLYRQTITVQFPDSLGVFLVTAQSFADGFYSTSTSQQVTTIDTAWNSSLTGLKRSGHFIVDERDGMTYGYITAGDRDWFSQNLAWKEAGVPFLASPATAGMFGSFYTWSEATSGQVCPDGWAVPTHEDWESLAAVLSGGRAIPFIDNWDGLGSKASADAYLNKNRLSFFHSGLYTFHSPPPPSFPDSTIMVAGGVRRKKTRTRPSTVTSGTTWAIFRWPIRTRMTCAPVSGAFEGIHNLCNQRMPDDILLSEFYDADSFDVADEFHAAHQA